MVESQTETGDEEILGQAPNMIQTDSRTGCYTTKVKYGVHGEAEMEAEIEA